MTAFKTPDCQTSSDASIAVAFGEFSGLCVCNSICLTESVKGCSHLSQTAFSGFLGGLNVDQDNKTLGCTKVALKGLSGI